MAEIIYTSIEQSLQPLEPRAQHKHTTAIRWQLSHAIAAVVSGVIVGEDEKSINAKFAELYKKCEPTGEEIELKLTDALAVTGAVRAFGSKTLNFNPTIFFTITLGGSE